MDRLANTAPDVYPVPGTEGITLGIIAGGRATRLGGIDKAWLQRDGVPLVIALAQRFTRYVDAVMVSANRNIERYLAHGLRALYDRIDTIGPLAGIDTLIEACRSDWLLTLPVDATAVPDNVVQCLLAVGTTGGFALDEDGPQPLIALWPVAATRIAIRVAMTEKDYAIHALQARVGMRGVRFEGIRFGNLNTPQDLAAAGIVAP